MKNKIILLLLLVSSLSFGQNKTTLINTINLKKSSLELFIKSYDFDQHIYDENLKQINDVNDKKIEISKLETQLKLVGIKKGTANFNLITETGNVELQKLALEKKEDLHKLEVAKAKYDLDLFNYKNPSQIKEN